MGWVNLIAIIILGLFIKSFLPKYFEKKAKNLATKEDLKEIETIKNQVSYLYNTRSSHEVEFRTKRIESYELIMSHLSELIEISAKLINSKDAVEFRELSGSFRGKLYSLYNVLFQKILYFRQEEYEMLMAYRWFFDNYGLEKAGLSTDYNIAIVYNVFINLLRNSFISIFIKGFEKIMIADCLSNRQPEPEIKKYKELIKQENIPILIKERYSFILSPYKEHPQKENLLIDCNCELNIENRIIVFKKA